MKFKKSMVWNLLFLRQHLESTITSRIWIFYLLRDAVMHPFFYGGAKNVPENIHLRTPWRPFLLFQTARACSPISSRNSGSRTLSMLGRVIKRIGEVQVKFDWFPTRPVGHLRKQARRYDTTLDPWIPTWRAIAVTPIPRFFISLTSSAFCQAVAGRPNFFSAAGILANPAFWVFRHHHEFKPSQLNLSTSMALPDFPPWPNHWARQVDAIALSQDRVLKGQLGHVCMNSGDVVAGKWM